MKFEFYNPTRLIFGAGRLPEIGKITKNYGRKALIVTGGGSVKRSGAFDRVVSSLLEEGVETVECAGIEPNPRITSVKRGAQIARKEDCDVVVALGGGSVMDAAKVIAAAALYDGDPWNMINHGQQNWLPPSKALPVITIPTLAATGSEMNRGAVISNSETKIKSFVLAECLYPKVALVDPELTLTVPKDQTAYGVCDIITHVTEGYFNNRANTPIQDRFAEGVIINAIEWGSKAVADGNDLEARTQVQWASIVALNGWVQAGAKGSSPVHMIEHALSAHHDIAHGAGLSIISPAWMRFTAKVYPGKFVQFAQRVFALKARNPEDTECALEGINRLEEYFRSIGCPVNFQELGIGDELFSRYAEDALLVARDENGKLPGRLPMSEKDIVEILKSAS